MVKRKRNEISETKMLADGTVTLGTNASKSWHYYELCDVKTFVDTLVNENRRVILKKLYYQLELLHYDDVETSPNLICVQPVFVKVLEEGALPTTWYSNNQDALWNVLDQAINTDFAVREVGSPRQPALSDPRPTFAGLITRFIVNFGITFPSVFDPVKDYPKEKYAIGLMILQDENIVHTNDTSMQIWGTQKATWREFVRHASTT
jgi:hypothetical protein